MASYLITGSGRGIGLELCRALAAKPASEVSIVFATYRTNTDALEKLVSSSLGRVEAVPMDVSSEESIKQGASQIEKSLAGKGLDVLVNNAGCMPFSPNGIHTMDHLASTFDTNVTSVHNVTRTLLPLLEKGTLKKVVNVSSTVGSIYESHLTRHMPTPAYKITKAALNMLTLQWAEEYESKGFTICAISPGWIKTDLGGQAADLEIEQAIPKVMELVLRQNKEDNGRFLDILLPGFEPKYNRRIVPW